MEIQFKYPEVMRFFKEISAIPRGSFNEKEIADYLEDFALSRGLEYVRDKSNNVLINIPATAGYENRPSLLIQGHSDMVCEKNKDTEHDFLVDGLKLYVDGNRLLRAKGTTLGADNGVAVALMLFLLSGGFLAHPACQCLFTSAEEVGLCGAKAFDYSHIFARRLINLDSPEEKTIVVGSSGGERSSVCFEVKRDEIIPKNGVSLSVCGLFGGHSGEDIHRGRQNACKVMGRVLLTLSEKYDFRLVSIDGGSKENAIPRECTALIVCEHPSGVIEEVKGIEGTIKPELCGEDSEFHIKARETVCESPLTKEDTERVLGFISALYTGVIAMNANIPGVVEYSRNLGIIESEKNKIVMTISSRSAFDSRIRLSRAEIYALAKNFGATASHYNGYPGWTYTGSTSLEREYSEAFKEIYGEMPHVTAIHAGLECGVITNALKGIQAISVGPNVTDLHSPAEALDLDSFERFIQVFGLFLAKK